MNIWKNWGRIACILRKNLKSERTSSFLFLFYSIQNVFSSKNKLCGIHAQKVGLKMSWNSIIVLSKNL